MNRSPVEIHRREGRRGNVDEKCEGRNDGAQYCTDSLDSEIVPSGQVSGTEAFKDSEGEYYHPEALSWLIPLKQTI